MVAFLIPLFSLYFMVSALAFFVNAILMDIDTGWYVILAKSLLWPRHIPGFFKNLAIAMWKEIRNG